jgi:hypothetical protein
MDIVFANIYNYAHGSCKLDECALTAHLIYTHKNLTFRYTADWMYQCMLMRIRGPALYKHIREHNILPLPSLPTIRRHCIGLKATYGFQDTLFQTMKFKGESMTENQKRGKNF